MEIKIGCDPEIFVTKDGKPRSAHGLIQGTKKEPFKVKRGAVQVDGMALEFNTDPATTADEFVTNVNEVMQQLRDMVPGYDLAIVPSVRFNGNHFRVQPDEAKELGCDPDFNAYTLDANPRPDNKTTMRTASGHVHIGFCENADPSDPSHIQRCATLAKQLDWYLGVPSLLWDNDTQRRSMYGKAGAFRPKPYGVEYRVLSNAWLLSDARKKFIFDTAKLAVEKLISGVRPFEKFRSEVVINNSDVYTARRYIERNTIDGVTLAQVEALVASTPEGYRRITLPFGGYRFDPVPALTTL